MRRKTLEESKSGVIDFDAEIAKVRELESTARRGLLVQHDATDSSSSGSEFSGTEEEPEGDDAEGQDGEGQDIEPTANPPTSPGSANASFPSDFGGAMARTRASSSTDQQPEPPATAPMRDRGRGRARGRDRGRAQPWAAAPAAEPQVDFGDEVSAPAFPVGPAQVLEGFIATPVLQDALTFVVVILVRP
ncbi:uncharacterized protein [Nicotiana sylvestris]|uniref:uncharacterized protein n=1 Tax=Nicotiana sylvestris TaxID=4096 RepID=UPI00388C9256